MFDNRRVDLYWPGRFVGRLAFLNRAGLFLVLLGTSLTGLVVVIAWYLASNQSGSSSLGGFMGQMMGSQSVQGMPAMSGYVWGTSLILVVLAIVGVVGLAYYLAFPWIKTVPAKSVVTGTSKETAASPKEVVPSPMEAASPKENWATVIRTSNPEERKVLEVLAAHNGTYLQKFVVKESGLSRLKTHRIVSRFTERGIVVAAKSGNTNELSLSPWLMNDMTERKSQAA